LSRWSGRPAHHVLPVAAQSPVVDLRRNTIVKLNPLNVTPGFQSNSNGDERWI
jgi:hypothetical protein